MICSATLSPPLIIRVFERGICARGLSEAFHSLRTYRPVSISVQLFTEVMRYLH